MRGEQAGRRGIGRQVGVKAKHDIGVGRRALQPDARQERPRRRLR